MKIKDIVLLASQMCNEKLADRYFVEEGTDASTDETVKKFVACCNSVLDELACDYAPVLSKKTLQSTNGFAPLQEDESVVSLFSCGEQVHFRETNGGVIVPDGTYQAVIALRPQKADFDDVAVVGSNKITPRIVAYGVSAEYCLLQGNYDEATLWDKRFKDALSSAKVKRCEMKMPSRRWC